MELLSLCEAARNKLKAEEVYIWHNAQLSDFYFFYTVFLQLNTDFID